MAVWATRSLKINDRVHVETASGASAPVVNLGDHETIVGSDAIVGNLQSVADVVLRERATVAGMLQTSGSVSSQNGVTIQGSVSEQHDLLGAVALQTWSVFIANEAHPPVQLAPGQELTLGPGTYGPLQLGVNAKLHLAHGTYSFASVSLEPGSEVRFSTDEGPAFVQVFESFSYKGRFVKVGQNPHEVLVSYVGASPAWIQAPFYGTLVAPEAKIDVAAVGGEPHHASFFGYEVEVHADARIIQTPFPWEALDEAMEDAVGEPSDYPLPTFTGPPPSLSGEPVRDRVLAFLDWFYLALKGDLPSIADEIETVEGNNAIAAELISEFQRLRSIDATRARMVLSVLGQLRSPLGEDFFIALLDEALPERLAPIPKHGTDARQVVLGYQRKAVHGLGYMGTEKSRAELRDRASSHPDFSMRAEVVRTYIFEQPEQVKAELSLRPGEEFLVDRFENRDIHEDGGDFDAKLAAYVAKYPEHFPPLED